MCRGVFGGTPGHPVTSGSALVAEEPFYLNRFFLAKKKAPTDTGETSAFKEGPQIVFGAKRKTP